MIIDPNALGPSAGRSRVQAEAVEGLTGIRQAALEDKTALLLFRAGTPSLKAVPLSLITRLEEISATQSSAAMARTSSSIAAP